MQLNPALHGNSSCAAPLAFHGALRRPQDFLQTFLINWLVQHEAGPGVESNRNDAWPLIVANQNHRSRPVGPRLPHLPRKLYSVRLGHVKIQKHEVELPAIESARRL